jgi:Nuclease-related domain
MPSRIMSLRRGDVCCCCDAAVASGTNAYWDAEQRTVTCLGCLHASENESPAPIQPRAGSASSRAAGPGLDRGEPGASAAREYRRRRASREARTRSRHPLVGGLLLAVRGTPQHERAWDTGSRGEETVGRSLERRTENGPAIVLHDRRMPNGFGNIDHLAIAPRGVFVIDAKTVKGKVRISKPVFGKPKLIVGKHNRTKLVDGLDRQVAAVRQALIANHSSDVTVLGVLCFTKADLPLLGAGEIRAHELHYCRATARKLNRSGPLDPEAIDAVARTLAAAFPSACTRSD